MSENKPKNITRSSRKGTSTSASDDEDLAMENTTPGGEAAVKQPMGLEERGDNDLTPTSETKLEGMIRNLNESIAMLSGGMDRIQLQVNELEDRSVPTPPKEERTPRRTERRQSVMDDLLQSSRKLIGLTCWIVDTTRESRMMRTRKRNRCQTTFPDPTDTLTPETRWRLLVYPVVSFFKT